MCENNLKTEPEILESDGRTRVINLTSLSCTLLLLKLVHLGLDLLGGQEIVVVTQPQPVIGQN